MHIEIILSQFEALLDPKFSQFVFKSHNFWNLLSSERDKNSSKILIPFLTLLVYMGHRINLELFWNENLCLATALAKCILACRLGVSNDKITKVQGLTRSEECLPLHPTTLMTPKMRGSYSIEVRPSFLWAIELIPQSRSVSLLFLPAY